MAVLRIRGVQMIVGNSKKDNLPKILDYIQKGDCDIIVFPEMSLTGYNNNFSDVRTPEAWKQIASACKKSYITAIIGTGVRMNEQTYIQARIYTDEGKLLGTQEKLVPTEEDRRWCRPGEELRIFKYKGITFGCLLGNDFWVAPGFGPYHDPRLSYQLGKRGAQIIFHLANTGIDQTYLPYYDINLRLRARESKCYIVTVNAGSQFGVINSASGIMSPKGEWLVQCPLQGEHSFVYDLEIETES
ncbi:MAG TPA: carbon-nitrogen hydrolase family protein [Candidatus Hydrogenedens sp.]|nr:carbon-nitrogen hydrolase family protein [Candidatus Hydrogenedens sp.]HOK10321.1 carbon-nitrogen hydrolase family protein [Candidatus Hydrogenedens sp.]HPP59852.1 carbon-nitrogen hydrolase family protein [Candidatus Hydrogenedens sp.]